MNTVTTEDWDVLLGRPCHFCAAAPGDPCVTPTGAALPVGDFHTNRYRVGDRVSPNPQDAAPGKPGTSSSVRDGLVVFVCAVALVGLLMYAVSIYGTHEGFTLAAYALLVAGLVAGFLLWLPLFLDFVGAVHLPTGPDTRPTSASSAVLYGFVAGANATAAAVTATICYLGVHAPTPAYDYATASMGGLCLGVLLIAAVVAGSIIRDERKRARPDEALAPTYGPTVEHPGFWQ